MNNEAVERLAKQLEGGLTIMENVALRPKYPAYEEALKEATESINAGKPAFVVRGTVGGRALSRVFTDPQFPTKDSLIGTAGGTIIGKVDNFLFLDNGVKIVQLTRVGQTPTELSVVDEKKLSESGWKFDDVVLEA